MEQRNDDPARAGAEREEGRGGGPGAGAQRMARELGERVEGRLNRSLGGAAARLQAAAGRIDRLAERPGAESPLAGPVGEVAHGVADLLETAAGYLRDHEVESLREDLRRQVRERPLQTLLLSVAAGWVVGKILR